MFGKSRPRPSHCCAVNHWVCQAQGIVEATSSHGEKGWPLPNAQRSVSSTPRTRFCALGGLPPRRSKTNRKYHSCRHTAAVKCVAGPLGRSRPRPSALRTRLTAGASMQAGAEIPPAAVPVLFLIFVRQQSPTAGSLRSALPYSLDVIGTPSPTGAFLALIQDRLEHPPILWSAGGGPNS